MRDRATPAHLSTALQYASNTDQLVQDLHGYSLVSILAALIETRLTCFCSALREERSLAEGIDGMKGSFVERVREYLGLQLGAHPPADLWRWVDDVMRVRQVIVDRCGRIDTLPPREQREITQLAHRRNGLELVTDQRLRDFLSLPGTHSEVVLRVRPDFCLEAVTAARGLFGYLYQSRRWAGDKDVGTEQH